MSIDHVLRNERTPAQYDAVVDPAGEVLCLACAGSSKPRTFAYSQGFPSLRTLNGSAVVEEPGNDCLRAASSNRNNGLKRVAADEAAPGNRYARQPDA
jgi:hypothetical protein